MLGRGRRITFILMPALPQTPASKAWPETVEDMVEHFNERAAILEFDGGFGREEAEARAWDEIKQTFGGWHNVNFWTRFLTALDQRVTA